MNNFQKQHWNNHQQNNQNNQNQQQSNPQNQQQPNNQVNQPPSILTQIAGACLPVLLKQFTGQEMMPSPLGGNNMEMQLMLTQVLSQQQLIINSQQALDQRLANLENNATSAITSLVDQVKGLKSVRLSHEKKQVEFSNNGNFQHQPE